MLKTLNYRLIILTEKKTLYFICFRTIHDKISIQPPVVSNSSRRLEQLFLTSRWGAGWLLVTPVTVTQSSSRQP